MREYVSKVWLVSQNYFKVADEREVKELDNQTDQSKIDIEKMKEINSSLKAEYREISLKLTDEELENKLKETKQIVKIV
jgi:hypothetical protein